MAANTQTESSDSASASGARASDDADAATADAPEASARSASTAAADGSAGGTTVSIAVYRSSFPIVDWYPNDDDASLTKAEWAWTGDLPERGTPGAAVEWEAPAGYAEPTRAGFEFAGWSTDPSAPAGGYLDGSEPALAMPEGAPEGGEYRLFALWTPIEYSVVFDLSKNPGLGEGPLDQELLDLTWESDQQAGRTVTPLGEGRYRVDGFTMEEDGYDPVSRTVKLPVPTRGGYWHVGWAEPEGQAIAIDSSDGWALNPVRLTQVDGTPVLTARWATGFGVTAPISVTFGDYDKTGSPENPSQGSSGSSAADDTTQSEADDVETPGLSDQERYEGAGQAYFENTSWHDAVKMVALESTRDPSANQVLTTYDSRKATEAAVLGDGTPENPGERLLSLYPSATPGDASTGVHFRLDDALSEADLASFATLGERGTSSARLDVSYGLNLSTDPVTGEANHGLVLDTDDYDRKPIARVSYAFAVADSDLKHGYPNPFQPMPTGSKNDPLYLETKWGIYGLSDIKEAANDLAAHVGNPSESMYYELYSWVLGEEDIDAEGNNVGPLFKVKVNGVDHDALLLGINQDTRSDNGQKAGLTFSLAGPYDTLAPDTSNRHTTWGESLWRSYLRGTFFNRLDARLRSANTGIVPVSKVQQVYTGSRNESTSDTVFIMSAFEAAGVALENARGSMMLSETASNSFQYQYFAKGGQVQENRYVGAIADGLCATRSFCQNLSGGFIRVADANGQCAAGEATYVPFPLVPCFAL